jgi:hypothetical protein
VCPDKFTQKPNLQRHMKRAHPDKPHAFVCEVRLMRAVTLNYGTPPRHVASTCVGSNTRPPLPPPQCLLLLIPAFILFFPFPNLKYKDAKGILVCGGKSSFKDNKSLLAHEARAHGKMRAGTSVPYTW